MPILQNILYDNRALSRVYCYGELIQVSDDVMILSYFYISHPSKRVHSCLFLYRSASTNQTTRLNI